MALLVIALGGVGFAIAAGSEASNGGALLGLASTLAAGAIAWVALRNPRQLAEAYRLAATELRTAQMLIDGVETDRAWSRFVDGVEQVISREHTMWTATRPEGS
jgi:hypothetical protein